MNAVVTYIREAKDEFKNVTWPTHRETGRLTLYVVGGSLLVGLFVGGVDALLTRLLGLLLLS